MTFSPMRLRIETERLILTPEEPSDAEWLAEIRRRSLEFDSGQARPISWEEVKQRTLEKHRPHG